MFSRGAAIKMYEVIKIMERKEDCSPTVNLTNPQL